MRNEPPVNAVGVTVGFVAEHVRDEIGMRVIDPAAEQRHDDVAAAGGDIPGGCGMDVRTCRTAGPTGIAQAADSAELVSNALRLSADPASRSQTMIS